LIVATAIDEPSNYLHASCDLLLDAEVQVGRRGWLLGYPSLVVRSYAGILPWKLPGEVGSQQFASYV
jgi:hypothetical protein